MDIIPITIEEPAIYELAVQEDKYSVEADMIVERKQADPFSGEYEYTPSAETQTVEIAGLQASRNITIYPIPQNYGLITWDGATLTVS